MYRLKYEIQDKNDNNITTLEGWQDYDIKHPLLDRRKTPEEQWSSILKTISSNYPYLSKDEFFSMSNMTIILTESLAEFITNKTEEWINILILDFGQFIISWDLYHITEETPEEKTEETPE